MLLIRCPYCEEERPELEFRNGGQAHIARSTDIVQESAEAFERFFFIRDNPKGVIFERWRHIHGCGRFFNAVRDTITDKFHHTYKAGEPQPDLNELIAANEDRRMDEGRGDMPADQGPGSWANVPPDQINVAEPAADASKGDA
ncbi:sarcosine oxidase subunit delta [Mesorhizobium sp. RP14(2022)]|uniref:Sarcosine oxidase subunit delta n=1 Tax=Mesorhizobium liriopis TaxID=2953882 RepID=A0ABT1C6Z4_9HYPH|nr:sarcosine oxidase subunit delta [Mesorhizobium liriopis]MBE7185653.1 sarcosine oxidase subunit delta [Methylobacterium mesophilicum]MCO6049761.1 sarcosine oxidase subunit delta [Mesorhizobium liriopis]